MDARAKSRPDYLTAVTRTAQYLAGIRTGEHVWHEFAQVLRNFFIADVVAFLRSAGADGDIEFRYCTVTAESARERLRVTVAETVRQVLETGFMAVESIASEGGEANAVVLLPLRQEKSVETVLLIGHARGDPAPKELLDIYLAVSGLIESTWARLHFEEQLGIRAARQARIAELGQEALRGGELSALMDRISARASRTLEANICGVFEWDHVAHLHLRSGFGWNESIAEKSVDSAMGDSQEGFVLATGRSVVSEDLPREKRFSIPLLVGASGVKSGASVLIPGRLAPFGVMSAYALRPGSFDEEDVDFLQACANIIAAAAERRSEEDRIQRLNLELELRVQERTADLQQAYEELEEFLYSLSHDLRIPVRAVEGFSRILLSEHEANLDQEGRRLLRTVAENAQRTGRLIDDILTFSRTARAEIAWNDVEMEALVASVWEETRETGGSRRIDFRIGRLPPVRGSRPLLREAMVQLVRNAVKFTRLRERAIIEVSAEQVGDEFIFTVADNGVGFDMRYGDKLFKVFERLHGVGEFEGSGIGLAMVKRIIARHGGRVWAEGKVGEGAAFHFSLPSTRGQIQG